MNGSARTDIEAIAADWLARRDGGDWSQADADALDAWLDAEFQGGRHAGRVAKISELDAGLA